MRRSIGIYRLNADMAEFLRAKLIRLIIRDGVVVGHYGRRGYINGALQGTLLTATLRDDRHQGHLTATFDEAFSSFQGYYATLLAMEPRKRSCSGDRVPPHK